MIPRIELKYNEDRDSFYIDCGSLENARHILNLIMYATEKLNEDCKSGKPGGGGLG